MDDQIRPERRASDTELREIKRSIKCLHDSFEKFSDTYSPVLDKIMQDNTYWAKIRQELVTHTAKGIVWATIVGLGYLVIIAAQEYARELAEAVARKKG